MRVFKLAFVLLIFCVLRASSAFGLSQGLAEGGKSSLIDARRLCGAIKRAEGNPNYGIINGSCDVNEPGMCRYMCHEIVRIRLERWNGKGDFIEWLGSSYCPPSAHPANVHWVRNVRYFYERGEL